MLSKFRKKKKASPVKNVLFSGSLVILVLLVIGFIVFTNWKINKRRVEMLDRISALKQEVQVLEKKNMELKEKKTEAESEDYLEKVARDQLDLKKPGEEVVVVQKEQEEEEKPQEQEKSWWEKFKSIWTRD